MSVRIPAAHARVELVFNFRPDPRCAAGSWGCDIGYVVCEGFRVIKKIERSAPPEDVKKKNIGDVLE